MQFSMSIIEVQTATGIGRTNLYKAINSGALKARKFGKRTIILRDDLNAFLASLKSYPTTEGSK